jgi:hypothetical protein
MLFNDTAIAVQVPYPEADTPIRSITKSTATEAGWIWDIGLQNRRGVGHVFASDYLSDEDALSIVRNYVEESSPGVDLDALAFRKIPFEPGYRPELWVNNCVAVGLSAGFVEPLEASALALIEQSAGIISKQFPVNREIMSVVARRFNYRMQYHWERLIEFLKLHYALSQRTDSAYWEACRDPQACSLGAAATLARRFATGR